jgi:hypothetical protein
MVEVKSGVQEEGRAHAGAALPAELSCLAGGQPRSGSSRAVQLRRPSFSVQATRLFPFHFCLFLLL